LKPPLFAVSTTAMMLEGDKRLPRWTQSARISDVCAVTTGDTTDTGAIRIASRTTVRETFCNVRGMYYELFSAGSR